MLPIAFSVAMQKVADSDGEGGRERGRERGEGGASR